MDSGDYREWLLLQVASIIKQPLSADIFISLFLIIVLISCSALISAAEVAFFSLWAKDIAQLKNSSTKPEKLIVTLIEKPRELLATILIANNFVNVSIILLFFYITLTLFDLSQHPVLSFIVQVLIVTVFIVLFGEVVPKVYSSQNNIRVARFMAYPLYFLEKIFYPVSALLISSTNVIEKRIARKNAHRTSLEEINHAIEMTVDEKTSREEVAILKGIVKFGKTTVKEVMQARTDVVALENNTNFQELMRLVKESGYSRIPVYKGTLDNIIGVLYTKDLIAHAGREANFHWQQLIRPTFFIPETKKIDTLLKDFQTKKKHMAVVVDEYGGAAGIITLEDIMEEVIGEIKDEFDEPHDIQYTQEGNVYIFEGKTLLNDICKVMNLKSSVFDKIRGDADSLAGLILQLSGKMPKINDEVKYKRFLFTVLSADTRRIYKAKITILPAKLKEEKLLLHLL